MSHEPETRSSDEPVERLAGDAVVNERWRSVLSGDASLAPASRLGRALFRHLPSEPRCKWCYAPYGAPFGPIVRRMGYGPWSKNPSLCGRCLTEMERNQGGAEIELAVMFADLRGSTQIAARMPAGAYTKLLNVYYGIAGTAVQAQGGIVDKYLGDGVLALFMPGYVDGDAADTAIVAGRRILEEVTDHPDLPTEERPLPVGVGIHSGVAYVGIVGQAGQPTDFTALGDAVNVAERVSSAAAAGELLISDVAAQQLHQPLKGAEWRELDLKGVAEPVAAWSVRPDAGAGAKVG
jgi:adenylate cyclase